MAIDYRVPILDTFDWQESVISRASTPPVSPARGDRYIVLTGTGAWSNATGPVWTFVTPTVGWVGHVDDQDAWYFWTGSVWKKLLHKNTGAMDEMFVEVMG